MSRLPGRNRLSWDSAQFSPKLMPALTGHAPWWLRKGAYVLGIYAIALFVILVLRTLPNKAMSKLDELLLFSAYPAAFYAGAAMILTSYSRSDHVIRPDELW